MKMSQGKYIKYPNHHGKIIMYSHYDRYDDDIDEEGWLLVTIFASIIGIWWGLIHLFDKFTFNFMPWWTEPFTIFPVGGYFTVADFFGRNPLHWWPMIWGYKIKIPDSEKIVLHPIDGDELVEKYGGPLNVHIVDPSYIKFRKRRDAVIFSLRNF
jgi:hypothetical protein